MINRVILQGFVADEPFVRSTERGKVVRIRLATVKYIPSGEDKVREIVEWHTVIFWGDLAHIADEKLHAGMAIYAEGELQTRQWEDRSNVKHRTTDIVASQLKILDGIEGYQLPSSITPFVSGKRSDAEKQNTPLPHSQKSFSPPAEDIDNLPF